MEGKKAGQGKSQAQEKKGFAVEALLELPDGSIMVKEVKFTEDNARTLVSLSSKPVLRENLARELQKKKEGKMWLEELTV